MPGPWDDKTPDTKYRMLWAGKWRPVLHMYDANNIPTTLPGRAAKVVLYAATPDGEAEMVGVGCGPADVMETPGHVTQQWDE